MHQCILECSHYVELNARKHIKVSIISQNTVLFNYHFQEIPPQVLDLEKE